VVDAGEEAHPLARLLQQELRDLGARPVAWLPIVRELWAGPLLRHAAWLRRVHLKILQPRGGRLRAGVVDAEVEGEVNHG